MLSHQCKLAKFEKQFENGYSGKYTVKEWISPDFIEFIVSLTFST